MPPPPVPTSSSSTTTTTSPASLASPRPASSATSAVAFPLAQSSFQQLLARTQAHLADPDLAQPDAHAAHSEVGRAFVGELRDADGAVVDGTRLADLALRLAVQGVIKREIGPIEKIAFLPVRPRRLSRGACSPRVQSARRLTLRPPFPRAQDRESTTQNLPAQDRFHLLLAAPPSALPPPAPLRDHPLVASALYLPPQPGYAFPLRLPRWAHGPERPVGGPSLEDVVVLALGREEGEARTDVMPLRRVKPGEMVGRERTRDGGLLGEPLATDAGGSPAFKTDESAAATAAASSPAPVAEAGNSEDAAPPDDADRSLSYTLVLTALSPSAVRPQTTTYPPSLTFGHPYPAETNVGPARAFETRLWPALRFFDGFAGGLAPAREAMARRLGIDGVTGGVEEEKRKAREGDRELLERRRAKAEDRLLPPHLRAPNGPSFLAPRAGTTANARQSDDLPQRAPPPSLPPQLSSASAKPPPAPPRARPAAVPSPAASLPSPSSPSPSSPSSSETSETSAAPAHPSSANESTIDLAPSPSPSLASPHPTSPSTLASSPPPLPSSPPAPTLAEHDPTHPLAYLYAPRAPAEPRLSVRSLDVSAGAGGLVGEVEEERRAAAEAEAEAGVDGPAQAQAKEDQAGQSWFARLFSGGSGSSSSSGKGRRSP